MRAAKRVQQRGTMGHTRLVLLLGLGIVLGACAAHEKAGDRAAAIGDWKGASAAYQAALYRDPESGKLRQKYQNARVQAMEQARQHAEGCVAARQWDCAL